MTDTYQKSQMHKTFHICYGSPVHCNGVKRSSQMLMYSSSHDISIACTTGGFAHFSWVGDLFSVSPTIPDTAMLSSFLINNSCLSPVNVLSEGHVHCAHEQSGKGNTVRKRQIDKVPFLDVLVTKWNGLLTFRVYQKDTGTSCYWNFQSVHPDTHENQLWSVAMRTTLAPKQIVSPTWTTCETTFLASDYLKTFQ